MAVMSRAMSPYEGSDGLWHDRLAILLVIEPSSSARIGVDIVIFPEFAGLMHELQVCGVNYW